ncbi:unnamed protein product [Agarophyton chilense]|eukprot:gb/GEZJ01003557.1/.p1 GENE.gb/GEZJ01003557.1/~~gb/GEZJ01003557.1/.p1  ORF type:complete len:1280 (-),score=220.20 gb/GEZJ01003557.1/:1730-5569(-)
MYTPGFVTPPPMNRFFGRSRFRTAAITMSSETHDSSIKRLQSLQKTLTNRAKSLRAQGIRGKADEAAENDQKKQQGLDLDGDFENIVAQGKNGIDSNGALEIENAACGEGNNPPQFGLLRKGADMQTSKIQTLSVPITNTTSPNSAVQSGTDLGTKTKSRQTVQVPAFAKKELLKSKIMVKTVTSAANNTSVKRNMSGEASLHEELKENIGTPTGLKFTRRNGSLPWKQSSSSARDGKDDQEFMPNLDFFSKDQGFTRLNVSLPWLATASNVNRRKRPQSSIYSGKSEPNSHTKRSTPDYGSQPRNPSTIGKEYGPILSEAIRGSFVKVGPQMDTREVISQRFSHLVKEKGISPNNILMITISNKNAKDIKERIENLIGAEGSSGMDLQVRTFHSLCVQLLRRYGDNIGIMADFDICGASDSMSMLTSIVKDITGVSSRSKDLKRYRDLVPKLKQDLRGECKRTWIPATLEQVEQIRVRYDEALQAENQLDFSDIVVNTYKMLHDNPHIVQELGKLYRHVLVDDWMGANDMHVHIVSILSGKDRDFSVFSDLEWSAFRLESPIDSINKKEAVENLVLDSLETEKCSAQSILENLNPTQLEAVIADPNRACLVMAGPGSGKTRVLTHRFAYLAKAHGIPLSRILAVTFTNKAANEMKERIEKLVGHHLGSQSLLSIGTFHSICLRLLRLYGDRIDIPNGFNVCDSSDSRSLLSNVIKKSTGAPPDARNLGIQRNMISKLKNDSDELLRKLWKPFVIRKTQELRTEYDKELRRMNLLDFDDILLETRRLLLENSEVLRELCNHYDQVLVDEWQDTNTVQFEIVCLLAKKKKNLFVVGDIDQSIYKFRGADVKNVKKFHHRFKNALEVSLDQNYRSTEHIVNAAHAVIEKNREGKKNAMITENGIGRKIQLRGVLTTKKEAEFVAKTIQSLLNRSEIRSFSDVSILYRTNAQSRAFEEALISYGMPYRLHSGVRFFERQEVKDIVSYLKIVANVDDDVAFRRVINTPARGIGKKTVEDIERFAETNECSMADAVVLIFQRLNAGELELESIGMRPSSARKLGEFYNLLYELRKSASSLSYKDRELPDNEVDTNNAVNNVGCLVSEITESVNYEEYLQQRSTNEVQASGQDDKRSERLENIVELRRYAGEFSNISDFLDNVALVSEGDRKVSESTERGRISMMTLHGGKGLEFPIVFIVGAEDNMLPISRAVSEEDVEEERRLFYVGITRAQKMLFISWRKIESGVKRGKVTALVDLKRSRFVDDIPKSVADTVYDYENFANG